MKLYKINCLTCKKDFESEDIHENYCSVKCYKQGSNYVAKEKGEGIYQKNMLKKEFDLEYEDYLKMVEEQNNVCVICGKVQPTKTGRLVVDYDYKNKKVRGLLCSPCKRIIVLAKENVELLDKVGGYLKSGIIATFI